MGFPMWCPICGEAMFWENYRTAEREGRQPKLTCRNRHRMDWNEAKRGQIRFRGDAV